MSLPSRERGLKYQRKEDKLWTVYVAPFAGAWIEICFLLSERTKVHIVAPFAGAWIEITKEKRMLAELFVAPFAGAWIEIMTLHHIRSGRSRRSLRGSVD